MISISQFKYILSFINQYISLLKLQFIILNIHLNSLSLFPLFLLFLICFYLFLYPLINMYFYDIYDMIIMYSHHSSNICTSYLIIFIIHLSCISYILLFLFLSYDKK
ncbi:hypothetical protein EDI_316200 [Entamoeba dispar SAW760]|uniref:Uncharacterized protein n=1 Tax=Entamoeba dispar (strain ATCC PRA-260 / SAW760) TaxID=370354 RepID=B0EA42_ENTDS|nr:uncharacterized protein EDI_316200 [Entamoeba dispar SAW760]EDR28605.1 hypothetical protein EDI_316200 [Entamoeba dispar SAW760]|eukprot:EDR28605.1 hypothetical protein EDI_316200 [Entamoeba dispar SAW760]